MSRRGFTLIELLVVISIIALLSSVVLSSLKTARTRAQDTQRVSSLKSVQTALELYYHDRGYYPAAGATNTAWRTSALWASNMKTELVDNGYLPSLPLDPINEGGCLPSSTDCVFQYQKYGSDVTGPTCNGLPVSDYHYVLFFTRINPEAVGALSSDITSHSSSYRANSCIPGPLK